MFRKRLIPLVVVGVLLSSLVLGACDGMTRLDIDVDPDTGEGTIDIIGGGDNGDGSGDTGGDTSGGDDSSDDDGVQTAIIFATVVALLLGVLAIVMSLANRRRNVD